MENFYIVLIGLWIYPIVGFILFKVTRKKPVTRKYIFIPLLTLLSITALGLIFKFSTTSNFIDWFLLSLTYLTTCLILWYTCFHKNIFIKIISRISLTLVLVIGYMLSTVGILGLAFIVGDYETIDIQKLENGIICKKTSYGNVTVDSSGTWIQIYKTITWLPIIEWQIAEKEYKNEIIPHYKASYSVTKNEVNFYSSEWNKYKNGREVWTDTISLK